MINTPPDEPKLTEPGPEPVHAPGETEGALKVLGGSPSDRWTSTLLQQVLETLWVKNSDEATRSRQIGAAMAGISPRDELEGMMAAQLLAAHNAAMECYRRAMIPEQTFEGRQDSLNQANKLSRTSTLLIEALNKHRGKGQQKVTVEHVHVHAGGQAVVGVVERSGPGPHQRGGGAKKVEERPHAKQIEHAPHAPEPALRSKDPEREPLPLVRDAERALPQARRALTRSAQRATVTPSSTGATRPRRLRSDGRWRRWSGRCGGRSKRPTKPGRTGLSVTATIAPQGVLEGRRMPASLRRCRCEDRSKRTPQRYGIHSWPPCRWRITWT